MEEREQGNIEYKGLNVQGATGKETNGLIYVCLYFINEVVSTNMVKLQLFTLIRIHLVVNISCIV